ncbi:unnamed protein product, partial [marine sediment metagenome]
RRSFTNFTNIIIVPTKAINIKNIPSVENP